MSKPKITTKMIMLICIPRCFVITADTTDRNNVKGTISINPDFGRDIDYEEYEVLYLTIQVVDTEQEVGIGEATGRISGIRSDWLN